MTPTIDVPEGERGIVRLFAVDLPEEEARAFAADPGAVGRALGVEGLDPAYIDVFPVSRVAVLGLPTFLSEGHGIAPSRLEPDAPMLEGLDGHVAIVSSRAFRDRARSLTAAPPLRLVGTWREETAPVTFGDLPAGTGPTPPPAGPSAPIHPSPEPQRKSRMTRRFITLLVLVLAVVGFIILNGGQ
jgi:hypothetical protein